MSERPRKPISGFRDFEVCKTAFEAMLSANHGMPSKTHSKCECIRITDGAGVTVTVAVADTGLVTVAVADTGLVTVAVADRNVMPINQPRELGMH